MGSVARPPRRVSAPSYQPPIGKLPSASREPVELQLRAPAPAEVLATPPEPIPAKAAEPKFYLIERLGKEPGCGARQVIRLHRSTGGDPYDVVELGAEHGVYLHPLYPHYQCTCPAWEFTPEGELPSDRWCKHIRGLVRAGLLAGPSAEAQLRTAEYLDGGTTRLEAWLKPFLFECGYPDDAIADCLQWGWHCKTLVGCPSIDPAEFDRAQAIVEAACRGDLQPPRDADDDDDIATPAPPTRPMPPKPPAPSIPTPVPLPVPPPAAPSPPPVANPPARRKFGEGLDLAVPETKAAPEPARPSRPSRGRNGVNLDTVKATAAWIVSHRQAATIGGAP